MTQRKVEKNGCLSLEEKITRRWDNKTFYKIMHDMEKWWWRELFLPEYQNSEASDKTHELWNQDR